MEESIDIWMFILDWRGRIGKFILAFWKSFFLLCVFLYRVNKLVINPAEYGGE